MSAEQQTLEDIQLTLSTAYGAVMGVAGVGVGGVLALSLGSVVVSTVLAKASGTKSEPGERNRLLVSFGMTLLGWWVAQSVAEHAYHIGCDPAMRHDDKDDANG